MKRIILMASACLMLAGCIGTAHINGESEDGTEAFTGVAFSDRDGGGSLEVSTSKGRNCRGGFVYASRRNGEGTFTCTNGESGKFAFAVIGQRGSGTATIGDTRFNFVFGRMQLQ